MNYKIYITSDLHFGHSKPFIYEPRGFQSFWEHDKKIIENWNNIINSEDHIYILGDLMLGDNNYGLSCIKQLKGNIHVIWGNHCTNIRKKLYKTCYNIIESCGYATIIKHKGYHFYLSHYPTLTDNFDGNKPLQSRIINICGHRHVTDKFADIDKGLIYHAELDAHNCYPVLLDDVIEDFRVKF